MTDGEYSDAKPLDDEEPIKVETSESAPKVKGTAGDKEDPAISPQALHDRLKQYLAETEKLIDWLEEGLAKGGEQLRAIKAFDDKISKFSGSVAPINTATIEASLEDIRKHISSLEEVHERIKGDIEKVERISEKITEILNQYQSGT